MFNQTVSSSVPNLPIHISFCENSKSGVCPIHFHDEIELLMIKKGEIICTVGGREYDLLEGDVAFINSRIPHATVTMNGTSSSLVQINLDAFEKDSNKKYLSRFINSNENDILIFKSQDKNTSMLREYLENMIAEYKIKESAYDIYIKANIYNVLAFLYRNNVLIDAGCYFDLKTIEKVMPALEYANNHFGSQISLKAVSSILNLDQYYFCRLFKKATNSTFTEYLNFVRVCNAEKLLTETTKNIMEVSLDVGFTSVSYFNRTFKKIRNCTPTNYRKIKYAQK